MCTFLNQSVSFQKSLCNVYFSMCVFEVSIISVYLFKSKCVAFSQFLCNAKSSVCVFEVSIISVCFFKSKRADPFKSLCVMLKCVFLKGFQFRCVHFILENTWLIHRLDEDWLLRPTKTIGWSECKHIIKLRPPMQKQHL